MIPSLPARLFVVVLVFGVACTALAETTAYIADGGADEVRRLTAGSDAVATTVVAGTPYGVAVTPDGQRVLVTQTGDDALAFISTADFSASPFVLPVGGAPRGVAVDPGGRYAYVANFESGTVSQVDVAGRNVVDTITVGEGPWGVAARYDERTDTVFAYVTNHLDDSVTLIGEDNRTTTIAVGDGPIGVAVTPDGQTVYVANTFDDSVSIIDTGSRTVVGSVAVDDAPWGVAVGSDGDWVYVTNSEADTVSVIRTDTRTLMRTVSVGDTPRGVAAPRNGKIAYVVNQGDGSVGKIDMDAEEVSDVAAGLSGEAISLGAFVGDRPPSPPSGLEAVTRDETTIDLTWIDRSTGEWGFKIERSREDEDHFVPIASVPENATTYADGGLSNDTLYHYRVRTYNEAADSDYSASASATTDRYTGSIWCFIGATRR